MSLQYEVQEHIRIDMNQSGMKGIDMIRALERQLAALEALMQDDEAEIYRIAVSVDDTQYRLEEENAAGIRQLAAVLEKAAKIDLVLHYGSSWCSTDGIYADMLPLALVEQASHMATEHQEGLFLSVWSRMEDNEETGKLVAFGWNEGKFYHGEVQPQELKAFPTGRWTPLPTILSVETDELEPDQLAQAETCCRSLAALSKDVSLSVEDGCLSFFLNSITLSGPEDWQRLKEAVLALWDAVEDALVLDLRFADTTGSNARLLEADIFADRPDSLRLWAIN